MHGESNDPRKRKEKRRFARMLRMRMTPQEKILWQALRNRKFNNMKFRRQVPIGSYIVDFLCVQHRIIIEVDGSSHDERQEYDELRDKILCEQHYKILRFRNSEIEHTLQKVLTRIEKNIKCRICVRVTR